MRERINALIRGLSMNVSRRYFSKVIPLLVYIGLPDMAGDDLIKRTKEEMPKVEVIAHTVFDDREIVPSARREEGNPEKDL